MSFFYGSVVHVSRNIFKNIYDEVTEDIFDMSNVRVFKETKKKNGGCLYFVMSSVSYASRVQDCLRLAKTRVRTKKIYALRPNAAYLHS